MNHSHLYRGLCTVTFFCCFLVLQRPQCHSAFSLFLFFCIFFRFSTNVGWKKEKYDDSVKEWIEALGHLDSCASLGVSVQIWSLKPSCYLAVCEGNVVRRGAARGSIGLSRDVQQRLEGSVFLFPPFHMDTSASIMSNEVRRSSETLVCVLRTT